MAIKCQYAGDPNDEYCKNCNGITMLVDGQEYACTECAAYVAQGGASADSEATSVVEDNQTDETAQTAETETSVEETKESTATEEKATTDETTDETKHDNVKVVEREQEKEEILLPDGVTVKSLRYMSGVTLIKTEKNGKETYYKFNAEEEWAVSDETGADGEAVNNIREALWDKLNYEIDSQIEALYEGE